MILPYVPGASLGMTFASDLGAAAKDNGDPKSSLRKEMDTLEHPSVNREIHANTIVTLDLSLQSLSLRSVTDLDVVIAGPSLLDPNAEHTGCHHPHPSRYPMILFNAPTNS